MALNTQHLHPLITLGRLAIEAIAGVCAFAGVVGLTGCETTSGIRNVDVTYNFDNVRKSEKIDDWAKIRAVLSKHSNAITPQSRTTAVAAGTEIRQYRAVVNLPDLRAIDRIQADLEQLGASGQADANLRFSLAQLDAGYRSNAVAAGVESTVSGYAPAGYSVNVFAFEGASPTPTTADSGGKWVARLNALPSSGWVYAQSTDPAGRVPTTYFRVNISTQQQQLVSQGEFDRLFPAGAAQINSAASTTKSNARAGSTIPGKSVGLRAGSRDEAEQLRAARDREDKAWADRRSRDDRPTRSDDGSTTRSPKSGASSSSSGTPNLGGESEKVREMRRQIDERLRKAEESRRRQAAAS